MHSLCTLVIFAYNGDRDLLFGETKSQQCVERETGISDPSESVIPIRQPATKVISWYLPVSPTSHMFR
jgi:hypothetical protein